MTPVLSEEQTKEAVDKFRKLLKANKSKIVHEESWGLRKLAYPIQKKSTGFYHLFEHETDGAFINKLEVEFKRDEKIIRFLTIKMEQHHVKFAEKRRPGSKKEQVETAE